MTEMPGNPMSLKAPTRVCNGLWGLWIRDLREFRVFQARTHCVGRVAGLGLLGRHQTIPRHL